MFGPSCGNANPDGSLYCPAGGKGLRSVISPRPGQKPVPVRGMTKANTDGMRKVVIGLAVFVIGATIVSRLSHGRLLGVSVRGLLTLLVFAVRAGQMYYVHFRLTAFGWVRSVRSLRR